MMTMKTRRMTKTKTRRTTKTITRRHWEDKDTEDDDDNDGKWNSAGKSFLPLSAPYVEETNTCSQCKSSSSSPTSSSSSTSPSSSFFTFFRDTLYIHRMYNGILQEDLSSHSQLLMWNKPTPKPLLALNANHHLRLHLHRCHRCHCFYLHCHCCHQFCRHHYLFFFGKVKF